MNIGSGWRASPRKITRTASVRHQSLAVVAAVLVLSFAAVHAEWSPMRRWNRALGDASLVLIALSLGIGPLARLWRPAIPLIPFRREMGVHGFLLAVAHAVIILSVWVNWDLMRLFGLEWHPDLLTYVILQHGFGLANAIGIAALILASLLAATSSDAAMRRLGFSGWKFLQMGVLPMWWLKVGYVGYFRFLHLLSFHRATPEPNPLQYWFVGLLVFVLGLRATAYLRTIAAKGASEPRRGEADLATI